MIAYEFEEDRDWLMKELNSHTFTRLMVKACLIISLVLGSSGTLMVRFFAASQTWLIDQLVETYYKELQLCEAHLFLW